MKRVITSELTDEEMTNEMNEHFKKLNEDITRTLKPGRVNKTQIYAPDGTYHHIEHRSLEDFIHWDIRYFNQNVKEYGNGFETDWDDDAVMHILYKDGKIRTVSIQDDDGTKRIKTDGIDSIIYDSGWGTAYAGPHVQIYNYREAVDYRPVDPYGYRSVHDRYVDDDDLRVEFTV